MALNKISCMTLGCPGWDLSTVVRNLSAYGFDAVDFRGIRREMDITGMQEFAGGLADTKHMLADHNLGVSCISTSIRLCEPETLEESLGEARGLIPVALELGANTVRTFGKGDAEGRTREELAKYAADAMDRILALDGADGLKWCVETHDHWITAPDVKLLLDACPSENFGVTWDMAHTTRVGKEDPATTYEALGGRIYSTHVKDAAYDADHPEAMKDGWRYVAPGQGQLPLTEAIRLLLEGGYDGYFTFEHEKLWIPELDEPEAIFPQAAQWLREQLGRT